MGILNSNSKCDRMESHPACKVKFCCTKPSNFHNANRMHCGRKPLQLPPLNKNCRVSVTPDTPDLTLLVFHHPASSQVNPSEAVSSIPSLLPSFLCCWYLRLMRKKSIGGISVWSVLSPGQHQNGKDEGVSEENISTMDSRYGTLSMISKGQSVSDIYYA